MPEEAEGTVVRQLAQVPLFSSLSEKELKAIARTGAKRSFTPGARVVAKGDQGIGFYLILTGNLEVRGDGHALATLAPGNFFGEMSLFEDQPRTADVVATSASECLVLSRWEFWSLMSKDTEVLRALMAEVIRRLRANERAFSA